MKIKNIKLKNFRCFEELDIDLNERCNVIVGVNGAGKSTILDALAISIGTYFAKIPTAYSLPIQKEDILRKSFLTGSIISTEYQFPVVISTKGIVCGEHIEWEREINGLKNKTTVKNASSLIKIGHIQQQNIQNGNIDTILPIIAYYGTGRLYKKKNNRSSKEGTKKSSRLDGYTDALSLGTNEKQLLRWFEDMTLIKIQEDREIPELKIVKTAIEKCFEIGNRDVSDVSINYSVKSKDIEVSYRKNNKIEKLPLHMFSDGIRITLTMVADIATRMAKLNPQLLDKVLESPGVILIDEIDMHLHPSWQSRIITSLLETFTNVQIVTTTHSPIVISSIESEYLRILKNNEIIHPPAYFNREIEDILNIIMETDYRTEEVRELINQINQNIDNGEFDEAKKLLDNLKDIVGETDSEVISARNSIELEEFFKELE
jgi:hypothetical protein